MEGTELISFEIISAVGMARSCYLEAIYAAKKGDYTRAQELLEEGSKYFNDGHTAHTKLIQKTAMGEKFEMNVLLTHAQDQLMSAEGFKMIAEEFIDVYKRFDNVQ